MQPLCLPPQFFHPTNEPTPVSYRRIPPNSAGPNLSDKSREEVWQEYFYGLRAQCPDVCYTRPKGLKAKKQSNNSNENREEVKISFI